MSETAESQAKRIKGLVSELNNLLWDAACNDMVVDMTVKRTALVEGRVALSIDVNLSLKL